MKNQAQEVVKKTSSVWDWKGQPSCMANDTSHKKSESATRGRRVNDPLPPHMQIYKEKK